MSEAYAGIQIDPKLPAWSFSAVELFDQCPYRYYKEKVEKSVSFEQNDAAYDGDIIHQAFETRIKHGTEIPVDIPTRNAVSPKIITAYNQLADTLENAMADADVKLTETKYALDKQGKQVTFFDKTAFLRAIIDVGWIRGDTAYLCDYKTGKKKFNLDQLALFFATIRQIYPHVTKGVIGYFWLKHILDGPREMTTKATFTDADEYGIWMKFMPKVEDIAACKRNGKWQKKRSGLCREWCGVLDCEHNGRRK